jgi:hypothetical protein
MHFDQLFFFQRARPLSPGTEVTGLSDISRMNPATGADHAVPSLLQQGYRGQPCVGYPLGAGRFSLERRNREAGFVGPGAQT